MTDNTKKPDQNADNTPPAEKLEDLPRKPITDRDATAVKGGGATPHMILGQKN
jgi:hypothetical protein